MGKFLVYVVLFVFLVIVVIYYNKSSKSQMMQSEEYLNNHVEFEGYITGFEKSDNHAFGVIHLKLTESATQEFNKVIEKGIYPYKIHGDVAEIYCTVSVDRRKGDTVRVVSDKQTVYYNPRSGNEEGSIFIITDPYNIDFVKEHTIFH